MEEFKGTKGEWKLSTNQWGCVELDNKHIIACYANTDSRQYYLSEIEEANANAKLIAAAPDILNALKECMMELYSIHSQYGDEENALEHSHALTISEQAIDKALK